MNANSPAAWDARAKRAESWSAALWSEYGQTQRFLTILKHLDLKPDDSLLDYGCGTGRFSTFLPAGVSYYGYDWSKAMSERARVEYPRAMILDSMPNVFNFDHIVCCGTFNLEEPTKTWETLRSLWRRYAAYSLIVSLYRGSDKETTSYTPEDAISFAAANCSRYALDATVLANDLVICLYR